MQPLGTLVFTSKGDMSSPMSPSPPGSCEANDTSLFLPPTIYLQTSFPLSSHSLVEWRASHTKLSEGEGRTFWDPSTQVSPSCWQGAAGKTQVPKREAQEHIPVPRPWDPWGSQKVQRGCVSPVAGTSSQRHRCQTELLLLFLLPSAISQTEMSEGQVLSVCANPASLGSQGWEGGRVNPCLSVGLVGFCVCFVCLLFVFWSHCEFSSVHKEHKTVKCGN